NHQLALAGERSGQAIDDVDVLGNRRDIERLDIGRPEAAHSSASEAEISRSAFGSNVVSARDHSARMVKKPVTFSTICLASSRLKSRPSRRHQTWRVRSIRLSLVLCDFTEDLMVDAWPIHAPGLRFRNPTDNAGP